MFDKTFSKLRLSGSNSGKGILVGIESTLIHRSAWGSVEIDEIWLYASNISETETCVLTVVWGDDSNSEIVKTIQPQKLTLIAPGLLLGNGNIITAFTDVVNILLIHGYVNRIHSYE